MSTPQTPDQPAQPTPPPGAPASPEAPMPPHAPDAPQTPPAPTPAQPPFDPSTSGPALAQPQAAPPTGVYRTDGAGSPDWHTGAPAAAPAASGGGKAARLSIIFAAAIVAVIPVFMIIRSIVFRGAMDGNAADLGLMIGALNLVHTLLVVAFAVLAIIFGAKAIRTNDRPGLGGIGLGAAAMAAITAVLGLIPPFF